MALVYPAEPGPAAASLILAHGAGAGQRSAFIVTFAQGIAALGVDVITFDFPYISQKRRIPDRGPALEACYRAVIETVRREIDSGRRFLFIGGKSMGGRIATQVAAGVPVAASCCSGIRFIRQGVRRCCVPHTCRESTVRCCSSKAAGTISGRPQS
jgi:predicted alpha/beta-hydrolase family hydrolase